VEGVCVQARECDRRLQKNCIMRGVTVCIWRQILLRLSNEGWIGYVAATEKREEKCIVNCDGENRRKGAVGKIKFQKAELIK